MSNKYRLIKTYPESPKLGTIVRYNKNFDLYVTEDLVSETKSTVENYPEFWELVVKKDYKVLSFELNKKIFKLDENKNKYFAEDGNYANYVEMLNDNRIISIRRLSDGEIFTIGDKVNDKDINYVTFTIERIRLTDSENLKFDLFHINQNKHYLSHYYKIDSFLKVKQPLFTTEDGVEIFEGNTIVYGVIADKNFIVDFSYFEKQAKNVSEMCKSPHHTHIIFSTKEAAEDYIVMNKPCLSINDVLTSQDGLMFAERKLKELVKSKQ